MLPAGYTVDRSRPRQDNLGVSNDTALTLLSVVFGSLVPVAPFQESSKRHPLPLRPRPYVCWLTLVNRTDSLRYLSSTSQSVGNRNRKAEGGA
jgi:hypothetical protein